MAISKVNDIFDIEFPKTMALAHQVIDENGSNFVSARGTNNGVSAKIKDNYNKKYKAGAITVSLKGSVMSSFLQPNDFYIAHQIAVLYPKKGILLSNTEKLFYCLCLKKNRFKFCYGRQADKSLRNLQIPSPDEIPKWVKNAKFEENNDISMPSRSEKIQLTERSWISFRYYELFDIKKGERITNSQIKKGKIPCIRPIEKNNGVFKFIDIKPNHEGNTITVSYNGSVGETFYQPIPYFALDDINILYPKFKLNPFIAMFLITLIRKERFKFNYGRKWNIERMKESTIRLPVDNDGKPDWQFMEIYIKSLNYSKELLKITS